jgi:AcrR family transcriptional regulator
MLGAMATTVEAVRGRQLGARDRILETAYVLFARRGVCGVGIDEVIGRSRVAKATLYRHFPSKDDLVVAFLELREQRWTLDWVGRRPDDAAPSPRSSCAPDIPTGPGAHRRTVSDAIRSPCALSRTLSPHFRYLEDAANDRPVRWSRRSQRSCAGS